MAAVFIAAVIVAFTWLATVRWARFGEEPREARCAPAGAPHRGSRGSGDTETPLKPSRARTGRRVPAWAHTEPYNYQEAA